MVGIPGKSKGCHTCRRRKIKCDLQEPNCARCRQSGRVCEGYKRGAVFLNRTAQGLEKRKRLEEAQPRHQTDIVLLLKEETSPPVVQESKVDWEDGGSLSPTVLHMNASNVMKKKFQSIFLETYLPTNPNDGPGLYRDWLCEVINLSHPGKVLEYSLQALSITRAGRIYNDPGLVVHGNSSYGFALRELQKALLSPRLAVRDETLAACYLLSIYELFESTSQSISGHENHLLGVERLVQFRGPRQHESPLGEALLKNICYSSMVKCIQYRKKSILKDMIDQIEWRQNDLILFSKGHTLGALLQDLDAYAASGPANIDLLGSSQRLGRLLALDVELQIWYRQLLRESPSPLYWKTKTGKEAQSRFSFATLQLAHLMLDYWALRLVVSVTVATVCHQLSMIDPLLRSNSQSPRNDSTIDADEIPIQTRDIVNFIQQSRMEHSSSRHLELAINIMESLPFCMDAENGISSSQKCLFSARVSLFLLQRHPSLESLASYEALYQELAVNKGLNFAAGVGRTLGRWDKKV